jgi:FAD/FMN-containing dehydrogenase
MNGMPTKKFIDLREKHESQVAGLVAELAGNRRPLRVKKKTVSNLFRYEGRDHSAARELDLRAFDKPLYFDEKEQILDVQGLATFESIVDFTLPYGYTPLITPELKHITVGGALVGVGIETNSFRYGFVHDGLLEAEVLLPDGQVVLARPDNEHRQLFYGLANSYGTLGYILRARLKLQRGKPFVRLQTRRFATTGSLLEAMARAADDPKVDYVESLAYSPSELYLTVGKQVQHAQNLQSVYDVMPFYRRISQAGTFDLSLREYLFRYDPEWFWAMSDAAGFNLFRHYAPHSIRSSAFYARFIRRWTAVSAKLAFILSHFNSGEQNLETLIQDWEVPWKQAEALFDYVLEQLDLNGKPLMSAPVQSRFPAALYPIASDKRYFNLGSYNLVRSQLDKPAYYYTKLIDKFCFDHDGIKMLYSSTFLTQAEFDRIYNGLTYRRLKTTYDPHHLLPTLFDKAVKAR